MTGPTKPTARAGGVDVEFRVGGAKRRGEVEWTIDGFDSSGRTNVWIFTIYSWTFRFGDGDDDFISGKKVMGVEESEGAYPDLTADPFRIRLVAEIIRNWAELLEARHQVTGLHVVRRRLAERAEAGDSSIPSGFVDVQLNAFNPDAEFCEAAFCRFLWLDTVLLQDPDEDGSVDVRLEFKADAASANRFFRQVVAIQGRQKNG